jgi:hypothetical protein
MIRIETEQLVIRNLRESDASGLWDYLFHPRVNCFLDEKIDTIEEAIDNVKELLHINN